MIRDRHGSSVEEVARIVQFESVGRRFAERAKNILELTNQRAVRRCAVNRPLPEVAERAGERTFRAGEKNGECALDRSAGAPLLADHRPVRLVRINLRLRRTQAPDPPASGRSAHTMAACSASKCLRKRTSFCANKRQSVAATTHPF